MYLSPPTYRDYSEYVRGEAYVRGWNNAMDYIFGERITECWASDYGVCKMCDKWERCVIRNEETEL